MVTTVLTAEHNFCLNYVKKNAMQWRRLVLYFFPLTKMIYNNKVKALITRE